MDDVRLIDANALKRQAVEVEIVTPPHNHYCSELVVFGYDIDEATTIDAAPVVHARWVPNHGSYGTPHCSNCKWRIPYSEDSTLDARSFCPNCGAKMDLKETNK